MPFSKGDPNINRNGRPPLGFSMRDEIAKALERQSLDGTPMKQGVAESLVDKALEGDIFAIKEINNRMDGLPPQSIDHTTNGKDLPTPILAGIEYGVHSDDSDQEDREAQS